MKNRLTSTALAGVFALLLFLTACKNSSDPIVSASPQPSIEITAVKLLADYEADEPAAEKLYGGRNLVISGEIMSINKNVDGTVEILLNSPQSSIGSVRCHFSAEKAAAFANVQRKDAVVVKGVCANMDTHIQVVVKDCELSVAPDAAPAVAAKPEDDSTNIKALEQIDNEILPMTRFISDDGILYVSTTDEKLPLDNYVKAIRAILKEHHSNVRWIKVIEVNTADPSNPDNPHGRLLKELRW